MTVQETIEANFRALEARDREGWLATFSPSAEMRDPADAEPRRGPAELGAVFDGICEAIGDLTLVSEHVWIHGRRAAVKWSITARNRAGQSIGWEGIDVFEFTNDGRIEQLTAYYEAEQVARMVTAS